MQPASKVRKPQRDTAKRDEGNTIEHAGEYGFEPYDGEAWHWNYTALMNVEDEP